MRKGKPVTEPSKLCDLDLSELESIEPSLIIALKFL